MRATIINESTNVTTEPRSTALERTSVEAMGVESLNAFY